MLKTKEKLKLSRTFARPNSIPISAYFCPEIDKKRLRHVLPLLQKFGHAISLLLTFTVKLILTDFLLIIDVLFARHNRVHDRVCVNFMKKSFSQSVSEPEFLFSIYNISTDQSKDDSHLETAGDYVLNTF